MGTTAIRAVLRNGDIGRLEASWLTANAATYAFLVVTLVVAYDAGGPLSVGILGVVRYLPPTLIAALAGIPTARWRADRVLLAINLLRAVCMLAVMAVLALDGPLALLLLLVAIEAGFGGLTRPLTLSLLPWLARTPGELVASNVVTSAAEGLGTLLGPVVAGILLATSGDVGATAAPVAMMAAAVLAVASISVSSIKPTRTSSNRGPGLTIGARAIARTPILRLVMLDFGLQTFVRGLLTVLLVVAAIERLGMGHPGVATLNAAIGAGGFIGAIVALTLTGRTRVGSVFTTALATWGLPIAAIGLAVNPIAALLMMAIVGISNALLDVTGFTLLQRSSPNEARFAVMGLLDSMAAATAALGGVVASVILSVVGIQAALVLAGAILPVAAVLTRPALLRAESRTPSHEEQAQLLQSNPLFGPLSLSVIEELAAILRPRSFGDGEYLIREGEPGDQYLIVADGEVEVIQAGSALRRLGPGSGVGEISLLRDVPRTASVRAVGDVRAYALERGAFLAAVTGHPASQTAARTMVDDRLAGSPSGPPIR